MVNFKKKVKECKAMRKDLITETIVSVQSVLTVNFFRATDFFVLFQFGYYQLSDIIAQEEEDASERFSETSLAGKNYLAPLIPAQTHNLEEEGLAESLRKFSGFVFSHDMNKNYLEPLDEVCIQ